MKLDMAAKVRELNALGTLLLIEAGRMRDAGRYAKAEMILREHMKVVEEIKAITKQAKILMSCTETKQ